MSWKRLEDILARLLEDVLKTSWKRLEDVLRRTTKTNILVLTKTSWRRKAKTNIFVLIKTSSSRRMFAGIKPSSYMLIFLKREERWWKSSRYIMYNHDYQNVFQNAVNTIIKRQSAKWMKSKSKRNHTRWRNWLFWSEVRSSSTGYFCTASLHCITRQHLTPNIQWS